MSTFWRTLESWTTQQDYVWFLALLAWCGVIAAELRRPAPDQRPRLTWLSAFAASAVAGFVVQLVLLAQSLPVQYLKSDFAMGAAQAAGTAALVWAATDSMARARVWRAAACVVLLALAIARWRFPVEAGLALAVAQAVAVFGVMRKTRALPASAITLLLVLPIVATHGPWAYAIRHGRRDVDWSHFALLEASCWLVLGTQLAVSEWRRHWVQLVRHHSNPGRLHRDFRRALVTLGIWLVCGLGLSVWYGRQTRKAYENYLLRRVELMAQMLDAAKVAKAIGPDFHITKIERRHFPTGEAVDVATVPGTGDPKFPSLLPDFVRFRALSPEMFDVTLRKLVQGKVLIFTMLPRQDAGITYIVHHDATEADYRHLVAGDSFITGPYRSVTSGTRVEAQVPIFEPNTKRVLAWMVGEVTATKWAASFTMARLQTMALAGFGVGFWALSIAYRLRREAREEAERKAAESVAADRLKSTFLAKVSHELRTPIQSVLGYGELLAGTSPPKPQSDWIAALRSHGTIMLRLVNDLIDLGALQSGAFRLELGPVDLRAVVEECVLAIQPAADTKNLSIQVQVDPNIPTWVTADGVRLRQILLNLLNNAVKFTPAGIVSLTVRTSESEIDFVVADTGPGIPVELHDRLFKPFARLDPTTTTGSGLGLALVHGLVKAMSGEIWLDETTSRGATFVVRLPLSTTSAPAARSAAAPTTAFLSGTTILVAEDNTLVRDLLVTFLEQHGAKVHVATDGPTAETKTRELQPDILLLDIGLPMKDGVAVAKALRQHGPASLRIIGLSAHAGPTEEARARMAGMDEFLTKPVSLAKLAEVLRANGSTVAINPITSNAALRAKLVTEFERETPDVLEQMKAAWAAEDWNRLRDRAHYLKNSADILGATALQDACRHLMQIDSPPSPAVVQRLLGTVFSAVPETVGNKTTYPDVQSADT